MKQLTGKDRELELFVKDFLNAVSAMQIYKNPHPKIEEALDRLFSTLKKLLHENNTIILAMLGEEFVVEDLPMNYSGISFNNLLRRFNDLHIEKIVFIEGIHRDELKGFIEIFSEAEFENLEYEMLLKKVENIQVSIKKDEEENILLNLADENLEDIAAVRGVFNSFRIDKILKMNDIYTIVKRISGTLDNASGPPSDFVSGMKDFDEYTYVHSVNVTILSIHLAKQIGLSNDIINEIGVAAILHDIGKEMIPFNILKKEGALTKEEMDMMRMHPVYGMRILSNYNWVGDIAAIAVYEHHRKYDRSGYPKGEGGIHPVSTIVAIADFYDALRSNRPYRKGISHEETIELMESLSGKDFDPAILSSFINIMNIYPEGSMVRLNTNEVGIVGKRNNKEMGKPIVTIIIDKSGERCERPFDIDLSAHENRGIEIVSSV